jgi:hypothetical protein
MWKPPWMSLVESLTDTGFESPYLDRLRSRVDATPDRQSLEKEILQEMARSLGRSADKVDAAFLTMEVIEKRLDDSPDAAERADWITAFNRQRDEARRLLRELIIHREALGMRHNGHLRKIYPIPPAKKAGTNNG